MSQYDISKQSKIRNLELKFSEEIGANLKKLTTKTPRHKVSRRENLNVVDDNEQERTENEQV